jgi:hypothetical protein
MEQNNTQKWVIIESTIENTSIKECHHRVKMFVANIIHDQSKGLIDMKTANIYSHAFNNRWFGTEDRANKYLAKYLKEELKAMKEMMTVTQNFSNKYPELML